MDAGSLPKAQPPLGHMSFCHCESLSGPNLWTLFPGTPSPHTPSPAQETLLFGDFPYQRAATKPHIPPTGHMRAHCREVHGQQELTATPGCGVKALSVCRALGLADVVSGLESDGPGLAAAGSVQTGPRPREENKGALRACSCGPLSLPVEQLVSACGGEGGSRQDRSPQPGPVSSVPVSSEGDAGGMPPARICRERPCDRSAWGHGSG